MKNTTTFSPKLSHKESQEEVREILKDSDAKAKVLFERYDRDHRSADMTEAKKNRRSCPPQDNT